jgi:hypothetical protein
MELTVDRVIGIAGIVAAIVLLVLDKAGKIKGGALFVLLGIAAIITLPFCFSVPWVKASFGMALFARRMLMAFLVGTAYSILCVWISSGNQTSESTEHVAQGGTPGQPTGPANQTPTSIAEPSDHPKNPHSGIQKNPPKANVKQPSVHIPEVNSGISQQVPPANPEPPVVAARPLAQTPKSAYQEVGEAESRINGLQTQFKEMILNAYNMLGTDSTLVKRRPPDDQTYGLMVRITTKFEEDWEFAKPQVDLAVNHALVRLGQPGPKQFTPHQLQEERAKYQAASPRPDTDAHLHTGEVDLDRYKPMDAYLGSLARALSDLQENPTPQ